MVGAIDVVLMVTLTHRVDAEEDALTLEGLWSAIRDDPGAQGRFRDRYRGTGDAIDELRWAVDPEADDGPFRRVRELERIVHARALDDAAAQRRDEATRELEAILWSGRSNRLALEHAMVRFEDGERSSAVAENEATRAKFRRRAMIGALVAVPVVVVGLVGAAALLAPAPSPTAPVGAPATQPTPQPTKTVEQPNLTLVDAGGALPPADRPVSARDSEVIAQTGLGERAGYVAYGYFTSADIACIAVDVPDGSTRSGQCESFADFAFDGVTLDFGAWNVTWYSDGSVLWNGI